jgi:hypothetical protein
LLIDVIWNHYDLFIVNELQSSFSITSDNSFNYSEQNFSKDTTISDFFSDEELLIKNNCKCGSSTHQRTSFKECLISLIEWIHTI